MDKQLARHSTFLSLILRHQPEVVGLRLDHEGWIEVAALLQAMHAHGKPLELDMLQRVVKGNDKQRFAFSADGLRIRASQGHSVDVDLGLTPQAPPEILFHGTASRFLPAIREQGNLAHASMYTCRHCMRRQSTSAHGTASRSCWT